MCDGQTANSVAQMDQTSHPDALELLAAAAQQAADMDGIDAEQLKADVAGETIEKLDDPADEQEATVKRFLRARNRAAMELAHVKEQSAAIVRGLESRINGLDYVFGTIAQDFARRKLAGKKVKSIKTLWGTLGFRTKPSAIIVKDDASLLEAIQMSPSDSPLRQLLRVEYSIRRSELPTFLEAAGGELPPGCDVQAEVENFYVK